MTDTSVVKGWQDNLKGDGYTPKKMAKGFSRVWRRVFRRIPNRKGDVFEVGYGGGKHLAQFMAEGWNIDGIDCSEQMKSEAEKFLGKKLLLGDFFEAQITKQYDVVFHVGVIEHYREYSDRIKFLKQMSAITKPGGYVISIVPINIDMKTPHAPEIDYTSCLMRQEFIDVGAEIIAVFPHNLKGWFAPIPFPIEKFSGTMVGIYKKSKWQH